MKIIVYHLVRMEGQSLKWPKNHIFGAIFRQKGGGYNLKTLTLNPPMKYVLFLQLCSIAEVIFLTLNLYIVLNTNVHQLNPILPSLHTVRKTGFYILTKL